MHELFRASQKHGGWSVQKPEPICIDCDHAFELPDNPVVVTCSAHLEYRAADTPATCLDFIPRETVAGSDISIVWDENID